MSVAGRLGPGPHRRPANFRHLALIGLGLLIALGVEAWRRDWLGGKSPVVVWRFPAAQAPERLPEPFRSVFGEWLLDDHRFRAAEFADCGCEADFPAMQAAFDNDDPYFVAADLNADGRDDFAVVLVDRTKRADEWDIAIAIFNGPLRKGMAPSAILGDVGSGGGSLLFYEQRERSLVVGKWEGHATPILVAGNSYKLWVPPSEPIPRDVLPSVGVEFVGEWYDGGPNCMKVFPRSAAGNFSVKAWYCNASEPDTGVQATLRDGELIGDDGKLRVAMRSAGVAIATFEYPPPNHGHLNENVVFKSVRDGTLR